ncbi:indolepyruvate oxidoreductase subunit beta [Thermospira aquatica]|uniref:Indolepyruvate oxidoreductase subunit beta n=1 Tax=Thermospira aquatica TaxID=2828656 RepID=A0AAX3BBQ2_9SPIR|nr:indolepyruvate oxidoreductase subunit beta [Thermospira aquatica]URA09496.1 indolepyruvate oxidoreductase subunit beta [Thermospira aquatica]
MNVKSVVVCGVGGQGIVLASDVLSEVLFRAGYEVKKNEIHGMSQREGSVVSFVRWGDKVFSPVVSQGEADILMAFEYLEGLRYLPFLKKGGIGLISTQQIEPIPVKTGQMSYPPQRDDLFRCVGQLLMIEAESLSREAGNPRVTNTLFLGVLSCFLPEVEEKHWMEVLASMIKPDYLEVNKKAFSLGKDVGRKFLKEKL